MASFSTRPPGSSAVYHRIQHRGTTDGEHDMGIELDEPSILAAIGWNIYNRRGELAMSQTDLAGIAGINRSFLNGLENGKRNPSVLTLIRLAAALETTAADLITLTDKPKRTK